MNLTPVASAEFREATPDSPAAIVVETIWVADPPLDRPMTYGISCGRKPKLADRLVRAIDAGVVFDRPQVVVDVAGKTYVSASCKVLGRTLNADLKKLGY